MVRLTRAQFVSRAGIALGGVTGLAGCAADSGAGAAAPFDPRSWTSVRDQFELAGGHHFVGFLLAAHPAGVRRAIEQHRRGLDEDPAGYLHEHQFELERRVRETAARYLGGDPREVALTDSTTQGLGLVYSGISLRPGQEILTTEHDFYATHEALRLRSRRSSVPLRRIPLYGDASRATTGEILSALERALTPRVRILAVTWVHSSSGVKLPVRAIADLVAEANAGREPEDRTLLCVDGVHGFGLEHERVADLGCDFFVSGCHKWLAGPRGTGLVWASREAWAQTSATIPSFDDPEAFRAWIEQAPPAATTALTMTPGGFHSFEHRWALAEVFRFHERIGRRRIADRVHGFARRLKAGLVEISGVRLRTPPGGELSAGLVCFDVDGIDAGEVVTRLEARRIHASVTPYARQHVRLGPTLHTDPASIDVALRAIGELAARRA